MFFFSHTERLGILRKSNMRGHETRRQPEIHQLGLQVSPDLFGSQDHVSFKHIT